MGTIDELIAALSDAVNAQHEFNKARDSCDDHSWDWAGHHIDALRGAQDRFKAALGDYIDERVRIVAPAAVATAQAVKP